MEYINGNVINFIIMYHGALTTGRGIENLINAISHFDDVGLVILGNGSIDYTAHLKQNILKNQVSDKVVMHRAVPIEQLWKYVGAADVSMATIEFSAKSYYFALPNKFFESIQSMTPIIASDGPEMKRIIEKYQIGLTCNPDNVADICYCIEEMRSDKGFYDSCKNNLKKAKEELCWEREKEVLRRAFMEKITNSFHHAGK